MSICQGGNGIPCLAQPVYTYLFTGKCTGITVDDEDTPDAVLQFVVRKLHTVCVCVCVFVRVGVVIDEYDLFYL